RAWRWCRRKPALAIWIGACLSLFLLGLAGVLWQWRRSVAAERTARQNLYAADMLLVQGALTENNLGRAKELLLRHAPAHESAGVHGSVLDTDLRGWEWRYFWERCRSDDLCILGRHSNRVGSVTFSPNGRLLAFSGGDRQVKLWDLESRLEIAS